MNAAPSALREMVKTNARELFRDGKTAFFTVLFPLLFLAMFLGLGALTAGGSYRIAVVDSPEQHVSSTSWRRSRDSMQSPGRGRDRSRPASWAAMTRLSPSPGDRHQWLSTPRGSAH